MKSAVRPALATLKRWRPTLAWFGLLALVTPLLTISNFLSNRYEVTVQDLIIPVILELLIALAVGLAFYRLWKRDRLAGTLAGVLAALVLSSEYETRLAAVYPTIRALVPIWNLGAAEGAIFSLIFWLVILLAAGWLGRLVSAWVGRRGWSRENISGALGLAIVVTFLFNFLPLAQNILTEWPQFFYRPPQLKVAATKAVDRPDIYYIVLDRYASQDVLKQQFGFDNSPFINFLTANGYYTNPSAHNNYPYTTMSIASTLSADYNTDMITKYGQSARQTIAPFNETIRNSPVVASLKKLGYKYDLIGNWYNTSNLSGLADATYQQTNRLTLFGHEFTINNYAKNILVQNPLWRFMRDGWKLGHFQIFGFTDVPDIDMTNYALSSLRQLVAAPSGGRFIFAHMLVPHDPYYFNADGSLSASIGSDNVGEPVKQKYLGQVQYINSQMTDILSRIKQASGDQAIVILQSDEGPYPFQLNDQNFNSSAVDGEVKDGDMRAWSDADLAMKFGNLAAYRVPRADFPNDVAAADSVNIFRLVFNKYFDANLGYLPDCYYAYPNGRNKPLVFADITRRLTGQDNAACAVYGAIK